uniref:BPTI/Kunitz inhibitor domain-containing protein n=1 Tax=Amblyomma maculatum TaxID=34609 RepID=G3MTT6_AMBMU
MRCRLISLLGISIIIGASTGTGKKSKENKCIMPINDYEGRCMARVPRYFYNATAQVCQYILWNGCLSRGLFETRFDCAKNCGNPYEEGDICLLYPPGGCEENDRYSRLRYFYNKSSMICQKYYMCSTLGRELTANSFSSLVFCTMHCSGFIYPDNATEVEAKLKRLGRLPYKSIFETS